MTDKAASGSRWTALKLSPFYAAFLTLFLLVAGGYWSLYADSITSAFPFHWDLDTNGKPVEVAISWLLVLVGGYLFFERERAVLEESKKAQKSLQDQARELADLVRTMPPEAFMSDWARLSMVATGAMDQALKAIEAGEDAGTVSVLQGVLGMIAELAKRFDGDLSERVYAANIMRFLPVGDIAAGQRDAVERRLKFVEPGVRLVGLRGVLDVQVQLSATTDGDPPDPNLSSFALPVPIEVKRERRHRVLPGAPFAFCGLAPSSFQDVEELREWMEEDGDFTEGLRTEVQRYFQGAPSIRSFVSLPLLSTLQLALQVGRGEQLTGAHPVGVLNIHCNAAQILRGRGAGLFLNAVRPLQGKIAEVLAASWGRTVSPGGGTI